MKVFVAGATGAVGRPLVARLLEAGHEVVGTTRREDRAADLRAKGVEPVVVDALDADALAASVRRARLEVVQHSSPPCRRPAARGQATTQPRLGCGSKGPGRCCAARRTRG